MTRQLNQTGPFQQRRRRPTLELPPITLMGPGLRPPEQQIQTTWEDDLGLGDLVRALSLDRRYQSYTTRVLTALVTDPEVIRWRQGVLVDFVNNPTLVDAIADLLPRLGGLGRRNAMLGGRTRNLLLEVVDQLTGLELFCEMVDRLGDALNQAILTAHPLIEAQYNLAALRTQPDFQELKAELPALRAPLSDIHSVTVGINLDPELQPESAALLAINDFRWSDTNSLLDRLIGRAGHAPTESTLATLHRLPGEMDQRMLAPLYHDLNKVMEQTAKPIARALERYTATGTVPLSGLENELAFFAGAARLIGRLRARGIPFCLPEIAHPDERMTHIDDLYPVLVALQPEAHPVANPAHLNGAWRIAVLTGPNSGGKTTYLRAVGLAQVMAQAGLMLPAVRARISPVERLLTHFPALENRQQGRLAEEAERLRLLFQQAIPRSLVLLNETFASTSSGEATYLAQDMLGGLRAFGLRAIYATHLTELADHFEEIERAVEGESRLVSLVAGVELDAAGEATPTYRIAPGLPHARSYAQEIARRHGIRLDQLLAMKRIAPDVTT
jgi:DNA mismatch repair protein MutS